MLAAQPGWVGHQETFCGEKEPVTLVLRQPQVPTWVNVELPGAFKKTKVHTLWKVRSIAAQH